MGSMANTSGAMKYLDSTIIGKYHEILCFYLEAVIFLERWPEVEPFIRAASTTNSDHARSIMVDMILMSEKMPIENVIHSLQVSPPPFEHKKRERKKVKKYPSPPLTLEQGATQFPPLHRHKTSRLHKMHLRPMPTPPPKRHTHLRDNPQSSPVHYPRHSIHWRKQLSERRNRVHQHKIIQLRRRSIPSWPTNRRPALGSQGHRTIEVDEK